MGESSKNRIKVWKDYTPEDAIAVIEKAVKAISPETIHSCWRTCVSAYHHREVIFQKNVIMFPILYYGYDCNTLCHKNFITIYSVIYRLSYHETITLGYQ